MTEWRLQGSKLPSTSDEWEAEFAKYRATPEFRKLNSAMTVDEFQSIYFWEWFHRMWGRSLGVLFAVPFAAFVARKQTRAAIRTAGLYPRLLTLFALGGTQGLVGWWMVKSGLEHTHILGWEREETDMPRVSPYRLATHLSFAFVTYGLLSWTAFDLLCDREAHQAALARIRTLGGREVARLARFHRAAGGTAGLVGLTVASGAFVAGNLAGLAYNDWPLMAGRFVPEEIKGHWDRFQPAVRNLFENIAMVQFDHRMLAYATLGAATTLGVVAARLRGLLPAAAIFRTRVLVGAAWAQASIGVATIMMHVPIPLGVLHQAGALTVWTVALWLLHALRGVSVSSAAVAAAAAAYPAVTVTGVIALGRGLGD